jgi:hypothetical protein
MPKGYAMTSKPIFAIAAISAIWPVIAAAQLAPAPMSAPAGQVPFNTTITKVIQPQTEKLLVDLAREGRNLKIDGASVFNGSDKFLTGKIALGLSEFISQLSDDDPRLPEYLKNFRKIAKLTIDDPNDSWGIYYYLTAIQKLSKAGRLKDAIDPLSMAKLRVRLDWRSFVDLDTYRLIDHPNNYFCVAFAIARLRNEMGWENREGADRLYKEMVTHYPKYSGENGFADETNGDGRFDRYSVLLAGEIAQRFIQTGEQPTPEVLGWLRKSADVMLHRINMDGLGFEYGRSIGPYGDTSIVEVLTAAAATNVLTEQEKQLSYAFSSRTAERYVNFWLDAKTGSVNLWDGGRRTDTYRGKFRILGENLSLAHQYVYTNEVWNKMGYKDKIPTKAFWNSMKALPKRTVTWFSKGKYDRLMVTWREGSRIISLPIVNGAASQHNHSPYFPIPFSPGMLEAVPDGEVPLMIPQIKLTDGSVLMPLAYFRDAKVVAKGARTTITYRQSELDLMGQNAPVPDTRLAVATRYDFEAGKIRRTDTYTPTAPIDVSEIVMAFGTFSEGSSTKAGVTNFAKGAVRSFAVKGLDDCTASDASTDKDYNTSIGAMKTKVNCRSGARKISQPFTISWELSYK